MSSISLKPSDAVSGGLLNDVQATIKEATFVPFTYPNTNKTTLAARLTFVCDGDKEEAEEYYSAGDLARLQPTKDGKGVESAPGSTVAALNDNTKFVKLLDAAVKVGFPESSIGDDITFLEGLYALWQRRPYKGGSFEGQETPARPPTLLVPTKILRLPGEKRAVGSGSAGSGDSGSGNTDLEESWVCNWCHCGAAGRSSLIGSHRDCFASAPLRLLRK